MFSMVLTRWACVFLYAVGPIAWKMGFCKEERRTEAIDDANHLEEKRPQAGWMKPFQMWTSFSDSRESISPFHILTWIRIRQGSSSSCSHKAYFKGSRAPVFLLSPIFTETSRLAASSSPSIAGRWGSPSYRESTEQAPSKNLFPCLSPQTDVCFFPPQILVYSLYPFHDSQQTHSAKQWDHCQLRRRCYHCYPMIVSVFALAALFSWAI